MNYKDSQVLVTGGAGFFGSEVVTQLNKLGAKITVLDNFSSGKKEYLSHLKKIKVIKGDIRDEKTVRRAVKNQEIVFNLAALPFIPDSFYYPVDFFKVNAIGTMNVLWESIRTKTVQSFVHISTSEVYGSAQSTPMDENHPTNPYSTYGVSKLAGDRATFTLHKENGFPTVVIRPFNTYGPRFTQPYIIPEIIAQLLKNTQNIQLGNVDASRDFTYVKDSAAAILKAGITKKAIGEIINIGSGNEISILDLAKKILKINKSKTKITIDESRLRPYDVNRLICDNTKAATILNWKPKISMDEGIFETLKWAKENRVEFNAPFKRWYFQK